MKFSNFLPFCFSFLFLISGASFAQERLPVPRFVSLKSDEVNLRAGPGNRYPIRFVYRRKHYPVEVIDEYEIWRQVKEIDGTVGWIHRSMLSGVRYVLLKSTQNVYRKPDLESSVRAIVEKDVLGRIEYCPRKVKYCKIEFMFEDKRITGWVKKEALFGVYLNEFVK